MGIWCCGKGNWSVEGTWGARYGEGEGGARPGWSSVADADRIWRSGGYFFTAQFLSYDVTLLGCNSIYPSSRPLSDYAARTTFLCLGCISGSLAFPHVQYESAHTFPTLMPLLPNRQTKQQVQNLPITQDSTPEASHPPPRRHPKIPTESHNENTPNSIKTHPLPQKPIQSLIPRSNPPPPLPPSQRPLLTLNLIS